jgi:signal transduction histidine kinase
VLALLLGETTTLYARLARSNLLLARERDNKLMNLRAVVASISHELKQPLAALALNAATAQRLFQQERPDPQELGLILEDVRNDSYRMSQVLDNLRDLFGRASLMPKSFDVNEVASEALYAMRHELKARRISTSIQLMSPLPLVTGQRGQLHEVITNLIINAIEAMDSVEVDRRIMKVTTAVEAERAILVKIEDTGPGIGQEKMEGIFEAFVTTKANGSGLGLAICRMIIEQHGGQLTASSNGSSGALFQFTLPFTPAKSS